MKEWYLQPAFAPVKPQNLVGWWNSSSHIGNIWSDLSGHGNHGVIHGAVNGELVHPGGAFGSGLKFNGSTDYVDCGNDASLDITDEITISARVKPDTVGGSLGYLISKNDLHSTDNQFAIHTHNGGAFFYGATAPRTSEGVIPYNVWTHVVFTRTGGIGQFYINGQTSGNPAACNMPSKPTFPVRLGCSWVEGTSATSHYNGSIDDVLIYNTGLSETEQFHNYTHSPGYYIQQGINPYSLLQNSVTFSSNPPEAVLNTI